MGKQTEIVDWCRKKHTIGRKTVERVLRQQAGRVWKRERGFEKNSLIYELLEDEKYSPCKRYKLPNGANSTNGANGTN